MDSVNIQSKGSPSTLPDPWDDAWEVIKPLGKGGQGITKLVRRKGEESKLAALKWLKNNKDHQARGRMRREVANLEVLADAGCKVPQVIEHNTDAFADPKAQLYVIMQYFPGTTLGQYLDTHGPQGIDRSIAIVEQLCETVRVAHSFPILHRDLKPSNIIVHNDAIEDIVTVDYGLSFNGADDALTLTNEAFRNEFLSCPETNTPDGNRQDPRTDLTQLCGILYFCLTGNVIGALDDGRPHIRDGRRIHELNKGDARVAQVETLLSKGLSPRLSNRFQTVTELSNALEYIAASSPHIDETDPVQLAEAVSNRLGQTDRKTQLMDYAEDARKLTGAIVNSNKQYQKKLGRFECRNEGGFQAQIDIPTGVDLVFADQTTYTVRVKHHPFTSHRRYVVGSQGNECILFAADFESQENAHMQISRMRVRAKELATYRHGESQSIESQAIDSHREWIASSIKSLEGRVLRCNS